jgi:hypothetical protein
VKTLVDAPEIFRVQNVLRANLARGDNSAEPFSKRADEVIWRASSSKHPCLLVALSWLNDPDRPSPVLRAKRTARGVSECSKSANYPFFGPSQDSHFGSKKAEKSPRLKARLSRRNSRDISKADIHLRMSEFDPSQGSHTLTRPKIVVNFYARSLQFAGIFAYWSSLQELKIGNWARICRKSPAYTVEIPVLEETTGGDGFDHY